MAHTTSEQPATISCSLDRKESFCGAVTATGCQAQESHCGTCCPAQCTSVASQGSATSSRPILCGFCPPNTLYDSVIAGAWPPAASSTSLSAYLSLMALLLMLSGSVSLTASCMPHDHPCTVDRASATPAAASTGLGAPCMRCTHQTAHMNTANTDACMPHDHLAQPIRPLQHQQQHQLAWEPPACSTQIWTQQNPDVGWQRRRVT